MPIPIHSPNKTIPFTLSPISSSSVVDVGSAPTGYGQYDQLFANNPYRNLEYKQSWIQQLLGKLGFRTGYDKFREDAQINAQEYDADVFALMQQNQYDSPEAQAQRMRDAGLNPDLQGLGDVAGSAEMRNDANGMESTPAIEPLQIVQSVSSGVLNIIPQVMSFATGLQSLKGMRLENDAKELQFGTSALDAVNKFFVEGITDDMYKSAFESGDWTNILDAAKKDSSYLSETLFSSPSARKKWQLAYGMHQNSLLAMMQKYQTFEDFESHRSEILKRRSSPFFSDDDDTQMEFYQSILGPLERFQKRMNEIAEIKADLRDPVAEQTLENQQIFNQQAYESSIDPTLQAETENAVNRATKQQNDILEATNQLFEDIMKSLQGKDNWWSKIAMAFIGIARAQLLSGMHLSFGRNNQYRVNGDTGVLTESGNSNFGFSF